MAEEFDHAYFVASNYWVDYAGSELLVFSSMNKIRYLTSKRIYFL